MEDDHKAILDALAGQYKAIMDQTAQGFYIYLDDNHSVCNDALAKMLGYKAAAEWQKAGRGDFLKLVAPADREPIVKVYQAAMKGGDGQQLACTWLSKDGKPVKTKTILVPIDHEGHRLALHWITRT